MAGAITEVEAAHAMTGRPEDADKPLMRSLGEFFGHVVKGIRTDPAAPPARPAPTEVRRPVEEEKRPDGVVLRRTVIEEVELPPGAQPPRPTGPDQPCP